jgi:hypothetical protein
MRKLRFICSPSSNKSRVKAAKYCNARTREAKKGKKKDQNKDKSQKGRESSGA